MGVPDLSAGYCLTGAAGLSPDAWTDDRSTAMRNRARKACRACPVLAACREWVLGLEEMPDARSGAVIAGMSPPERAAARQAAWEDHARTPDPVPLTP